MIEWINGALATLAASISVDNPAGLAAIFATIHLIRRRSKLS
jgi:hypothetical protein